MGALDGRVAIITGAGNGLGRAYALLFAREGASVVANDLGTDPTGSGSDGSVAQQLVDEITSFGGAAIANTDDVSEFETGRRLVEMAVDTFGGLDAIVPTAGILRPAPLPDMTEGDWDAVVATDLKGAFNLTRWASTYWRDRTNAGTAVNASVVHTCSILGTSAESRIANAGTGATSLVGMAANHWAARGALAEFMLQTAGELSEFGVRSNVICPMGWTRLATIFDDLPEMDVKEEDTLHAASNAPFVAWLASEQCTVNGKAFVLFGNQVTLWESWRAGPTIGRDTRWTVADLDVEMKALLA